MPSPEHEHYLEVVAKSLRQLALHPVVLLEIKFHMDVLLLLSVIDLGPAMPILERCYSDVSRGSQRKDPLSIVRMLILGACIGVMRINALVKRLRHSPVLATLAGFPPDAQGNSTVPAVATVYELLHRLHDGPIRKVHGATRPSIMEYEGTHAKLAPSVRHGKELDEHDTELTDDGAVKPKEEGKKKASNSGKKKDPRRSYRNRARNTEKVTEALRLVLVKEDGNSLPDDLPTRLLEILHAVAVGPSAAAGLLGNIDALLLAGDGSVLETNADGHGKKADSCPHSRWERCDCLRTYSDPGAARGLDHCNNRFFFGYFYYEVVSVGGKSELPVFMALNPANVHDSIAAMKALSTLTRFYRQHPGHVIDTFIGDCGHDGEPLHHYLYQDLGIKPVIPLSGQVSSVHPLRKDLNLDPTTAIPLCKAGCPMASWGTAGEGRTSFICPVKAGKIGKCPEAPKDEPTWSCRPELSYGPTIVLNVADNARLFPVIARNSKKYADLYNKRGACERANSFNKTTYHIDDCDHRRWSFWLIRLYTLAIIKHGKAWAARMDAEKYLKKLLGLDEVSAAA